VGRTWNRGLLFQSEDNVEVIRGNGRQLSNAAYSKRCGIVVSRTIPQPSLAGHAAQLSRYSALREDCRSEDLTRAARLRFGGVSQAMDAMRDQRGLPWLDTLNDNVA
jgi:hypothetical protein